MQANLEALMKAELHRATQLYGATNHSDHESYAVLKEEVEETQVETGFLITELDRFWSYVKQNPAKLAPEYRAARKDIMRGVLVNMRQASLKAAEELIQVAAMCEKAINTMEDKGDATVYPD